MTAQSGRGHDEVTELLGAYALDALDDTGGERSDVERHLVGCARCRAEVQEHREVAALLAHEGAPAPEGMWDRIADRLESPPPDLDRRLFPVGGSRPAHLTARPSRSRRAVTLVAAAAASGAIAMLSLTVWDLERRVDDPGDDVTVPTTVDAAEVVELEPVERGGPRVRVTIERNGDASLSAGQLPRLPRGSTYQLWGMGRTGAVSLAVLGRDPALVAFTAGTGVQTLAITAEPEPGGLGPTTTPLVVGAIETT